jgi:competence protein ComFC
MRVLKDTLDLFFPKTCPVCGNVISYDELICFRCRNEIPPVEMENNLKGNWHFDAFFHRSKYEGIISELIGAYKYSQHSSLATLFSELLSELFQIFPPPPHSVITSVPITFDSFKVKGFDHVKLVAKKFSKETGLPFLSMLEVISQRKQQVGSAKHERQSLVEGKYGVRKETLYKTSGNIILIDDVFTTGSTINECSKVLKLAGAKSVFVYTIALAKGKKYT